MLSLCDEHRRRGGDVYVPEFLTLAPDISGRSSARCEPFAAGGRKRDWPGSYFPRYCGIGGPLSVASAIRMIRMSPMTRV